MEILAELRTAPWARCTLLGLLGVVSCTGSGASEPAASTAEATAPAEGAEAPAAAAEDAPPDRAHHMRATFWMAVDARDALIAGDLEEAKRQATLLAEHDYGDELPEAWFHWIKDMQRHAGDMAVAGSIDEAAKSLGSLALSCANCHWQAEQGPEQPRDPPLPWEDPPDAVGERMFRHEVGADQMWMGLIDPSEDAWRNGTITLTRAPLTPPRRDADQSEIDPESHARVEAVRAIAKRARAARSHEERAQVYAELVTTCADCHQRTPRPEGM